MCVNGLVSRKNNERQETDVKGVYQRKKGFCLEFRFIMRKKHVDSVKNKNRQKGFSYKKVNEVFRKRVGNYPVGKGKKAFDGGYNNP